MCNALSPEKAVIWSVLHGADTDALSADTFRHAPYQAWFDVARTLQAQGHALSLDHFERELARRNITLSPKDARALKRMLKVAPPPRIRNNALAFMQALTNIQSGQPVELHRLIN